MYKISHETIDFIENNMKNWRVELTAGGKGLAETKIQRGIFQGDELSPLLFIIAMMPLSHILRKFTAGYKLSRSQEKVNHLLYMDDIKLFAKNEKELETLIHTIRIYSQDIGMEFGIKKCALLVMKSGKRHLTDGIELPNQDKIRTLAENETYKYLGILEAEIIKQVEMKNKIQKEYLRRTTKLLETKLNCRNLIKGINTLAIPLDRYSGPFLKWTRDELRQMDQRTRKLMKGITSQRRGITSQRRRWQTICTKERWRKRTGQHRRQCWHIHTTTQRLRRKTRKRTDYGHQTQY